MDPSAVFDSQWWREQSASADLGILYISALHTIICHLYLIISRALSLQNGSTALLMAANNGHSDLVRLLLDKGANIDTVNDVC